MKAEQVLSTAVLSLLILMAPEVSHCQNIQPSSTKGRGATQTAKKAPRNTAASMYLTTSFEAVGSESLGLHFAGHDIEAIYKAIERIGVKTKKSEYETTTDFEKRKASAQTAKLFGSVNLNSRFAFVLRQSVLAYGVSFSSKYDADSQLLSIELPAMKETLYLESAQPEFFELLATRQIGSSDSYRASNAFGAFREVQRSYYNEYGFALDEDTWPFDFVSKRDIRPTAKFGIEAAPELARTLKTSLRLVLIGHIKEPWSYHDVSGHEPTIDAPYDTTHSKYLLYFRPEQIWAVDDLTGRVLRKFTPLGPDKKCTVQISGNGTVYIRRDSEPEQLQVLSGTMMFKALRSITVRVSNDYTMRELKFTLNGKAVMPDWQVKRDSLSSSMFESATAEFSVEEPAGQDNQSGTKEP